VAVVTAWWFVRNVVLYGDPSASAGVGRLGLSYPRYHLDGLSGVGHIVEELVTYLWLPTEYVRNTIAAPGVLKALLLAATAAAVVIGVATTRRRLADRSAAMLVLGCGAIAFTAWLVLFLGAQASPGVWPTSRFRHGSRSSLSPCCDCLAASVSPASLSCCSRSTCGRSTRSRL
jgi:D-alanyl-D-alanine carboxypeptidase (penicillin-binding protein 5/6)